MAFPDFSLNFLPSHHPFSLTIFLRLNNVCIVVSIEFCDYKDEQPILTSKKLSTNLLLILQVIEI